MTMPNVYADREFTKFKEVDGETAVKVSVVETVGSSGSTNTQYTEGAIDASLTGIVSMAEGPGDTATPLQVDASKNLKVSGPLTNTELRASAISVDGSGVTQPVSDGGGSLTVDGSVSASQSGTWDIGTVSTITNVVHIDDNAGSITVDGTVTANQGGTWNINNITGTVSLPTGAATETTLATLSQSQASTTSGQSGPLIQGAVTTAAPSYTTGKTNPISLTTSGAVRVDGSGSTQPVSGTVAATQSGSWSVDASGVPVPVTDNGGSLTIDGTVAATQSGTWNVGTVTSVTNVVHVDDNSSTLSIDDGGGSITVDGTVTATPSGTYTTKETRSATGTQTSVAASATNVTLLASNANRLGAVFYNDSTSILYLRCAATATASNYTVKMFPEDIFELPFNYTGIVDGIWVSATGNCRVTEYT